MREGEYVDALIDEYAALLSQNSLKNLRDQYDEAQIHTELSVSADWSLAGAREIVKLAEEYGTFMLRNALAIAVVLGKEDGSAGF